MAIKPRSAPDPVEPPSTILSLGHIMTYYQSPFSHPVEHHAIKITFMQTTQTPTVPGCDLQPGFM
jgi:hypothetical protein